MQQEAITVPPRKESNPPSSRLSPLPTRTDVDTQCSQVPPSKAFSQSKTLRSVHNRVSSPLQADKVSDYMQSLAPYRSLLSTSGTFDLFFKVLFIFRSRYFFAIGVERDFVHAGLFVAGLSTDFRIKCRRPCGTGASTTPIRLKPASPALRPTPCARGAARSGRAPPGPCPSTS
jgi:hypothetical protein